MFVRNACAWCAFPIALLTGSAGLAEQPACDPRAIVGKWEGWLTVKNGGQKYDATLAIRDDGTWENFVHGLRKPRFVGSMKVEQGKCRWQSDTTGRVGSFQLSGAGAERVLMMLPDDGATQIELKPMLILK